VPTTPARRCTRCRALFQGPRCPTCNPPWVRRTASWPDGSTRLWRRVRAAQLAAEPLCAMCGALADVADHIDGTDYATQRYDLAMLRSLCTPCHRTRTAAQGNDAQKGHRP
jgi:5-methylcytosine-specific restriction protein A